MTGAQPSHSEIVRGSWHGGFKGAGTLKSSSGTLPIGAPVDFGGSGTGHSPSMLLINAASGCFLLMLAAIVEQEGVDTDGITIDSEGIFEGTAPPVLRAIVHRPTICIARRNAAKRGALETCFERAKGACVVTRALSSVAVTVEGHIAIAED